MMMLTASSRPAGKLRSLDGPVALQAPRRSARAGPRSRKKCSAAYFFLPLLFFLPWLFSSSLPVPPFPPWWLTNFTH
jgi:hypothetical protein